MLIKDVAKLSPTERFIYWIKERHNIYLRRQAGKPRPWTDDDILQKFFFTNPYREHDKVTVWFQENIREPLRDDPAVLFATVCFRWFNYIPTGEILNDYGYLTDWNQREVVAKLAEVRREGWQVFTGAYMINSPGGEPKLEAICRRINNVWEAREELLDSWPFSSMREAHKKLTAFEGLGGFMAYEIVCDLRYTALLEDAEDKLTWSNPGPGAIRGLYRILGIEIKNKSNSTSPPPLKDYQEQTAKLLKLVQKRLPSFPPFEMREIEHSLCEFDKHSRLLFGEGRSKRLYNGVEDKRDTRLKKQSHEDI